MDSDEQAIRNLLSEWARASADADLPKLLTMMADDVIFLRPGCPPMQGKADFSSSFLAATQNQRIAAECDPQEIVIDGKMAFCWANLTVKVIPMLEGTPMQLSGNTLTILIKQSDSSWVISRDANMLTPVQAG